MKQSVENRFRKTLFNGCGILIQKITNPKDFTFDNESLAYIFGKRKICEKQVKIQETANPKTDDRIVKRIGNLYKCISPLGFYYNKPVQTEDKYKDVGEKKVYLIPFNNDGYYEISYLINYNDTQISHETRPWDLIGNGLQDNLIKALENILQDILEFMVSVKYRKNEIQEFKRNLFIDIFGSSDGVVKNLTDKIKIELHGFDPKTSFRKAKAV